MLKYLFCSVLIGHKMKLRSRNCLILTHECTYCGAGFTSAEYANWLSKKRGRRVWHFLIDVLIVAILIYLSLFS